MGVQGLILPVGDPVDELLGRIERRFVESDPHGYEEGVEDDQQHDPQVPQATPPRVWQEHKLSGKCMDSTEFIVHGRAILRVLVDATIVLDGLREADIVFAAVVSVVDDATRVEAIAASFARRVLPPASSRNSARPPIPTGRTSSVLQIVHRAVRTAAVVVVHEMWPAAKLSHLVDLARKLC